MIKYATSCLLLIVLFACQRTTIADKKQLSNTEVYNLKINDNPNAAYNIGFGMRQTTKYQLPNGAEKTYKMNNDIQVVYLKDGEVQFEINLLDLDPDGDAAIVSKQNPDAIIRKIKMVNGQLYMFNDKGGIIAQKAVTDAKVNIDALKRQAKAGSVNGAQIAGAFAGMQIEASSLLNAPGVRSKTLGNGLIALQMDLKQHALTAPNQQANPLNSPANKDFTPAIQQILVDTLQKIVLASKTLNDKGKELSFIAYDWDTNNPKAPLLKAIHQEATMPPISKTLTGTGKTLQDIEFANMVIKNKLAE